MKKTEALFASIVLVLGLGYLAMALQMPRGTLMRPGAGYYPTFVGAMLVVLTGLFLLLGIIRGVRAAQPAVGPQTEPPAHTRTAKIPAPLLLGAVLAMFNLALYYLGYLVAIVALLLLSVRLFGYRKWLGTLVITGLTVLISYVLFVVYLGVPLPKGQIW